jgi:hypothetical protein
MKYWKSKNASVQQIVRLGTKMEAVIFYSNKELGRGKDHE